MQTETMVTTQTSAVTSTKLAVATLAAFAAAAAAFIVSPPLSQPDMSFPVPPSFATSTITMSWGNTGTAEAKFPANKIIFTITAVDANGARVNGSIMVSGSSYGNPYYGTSGNNGTGFWSVAAGKTFKSVYKNVKLPAGTVKLVFSLDPNNLAPESNEANNKFELPLSILVCTRDSQTGAPLASTVVIPYTNITYKATTKYNNDTCSEVPKKYKTIGIAFSDTHIGLNDVPTAGVDQAGVLYVALDKRNDFGTPRTQLQLNWASDTPYGAANPSAQQVVAKFLISNNAGQYDAIVNLVNIRIDSPRIPSAYRQIKYFVNSLASTPIATMTVATGTPITNFTTLQDQSFTDVTIAPGSSKTFFVTMDTRDLQPTDSITVVLYPSRVVWSDGILTGLSIQGSELNAKTFTY